MRPPDGGERRPAGDSVWAGTPRGIAGHGDVVETGSPLTLWPWRGARGTATGIALAALVAGLLLGYTAGHLTASTGGGPAKAAATRTATAVPLPGIADVSFTGNRCAIQHGSTLQLGIEIDNQSGSTINVDQITSKVPLGGLRQIDSELGTCGSLQVPGGLPLTTIVDGATAWLTLTFAVKVRCPAPYPVLFVMSYDISGKKTSVYFDGFPDLGLVPYTGCRART
ncbi:MAG TPA: hypothetical protein VN840_03825 [Streptosporangiaceae bacterium]|nr:hypothetical protein [Streptosporangiaceae bacterium]